MIGGGKMWAECGYVYFDNGMTQSGDVTFTNSNTSSSSYQDNYTGTYTLPATFADASVSHTFSKGLKMGSADVINFTTQYPTILTVVQSLTRSGETGNLIKIDGETLTNRTDETDIAIYTYSLAAGSHSISRAGQCGLLFIGVQSDIDIYDDSYPFTWDFENNDWASTKVEVVRTNNWNVASGNNEARPTMVLDTNIKITDVDMIKGLLFTTSNASDLCLDWTNKQLWLNGTITIPSVKVGQTITITGSNLNNISDFSSNLTSNGDGSYTVNTDGDASFTTTSTYFKTISVTKTDVNLSSMGSQTYAWKIDGSISHTIFLRDYTTATTIYNFDSSDASNITVTSSNTDVMTVSGFVIGTNGRMVVTASPVGEGSASLIVAFSGNDKYNVKNSPFTTNAFTITKYESTVAFTNSGDQTQNFSSNTYTNAATATYNNTATGQTITYSSSDENVATVDANGQVTFVNSGVTTITATASETENYAAATASYQLTVQGSTTPTLSWDTEHFSNLDGTTLNYGNLQYCYAVSSDGATDITYSTSDERIATVTTEQYEIPGSGGTVQRCKITPTGNGSVTIYANLAGHGDANPATPISFSITVIAGVADINFKPEKGTINKDKTVTPYLSFPNMLADDIISFTATSSDTNIATVTSDLKASGLVDGDGYLRKVYPTITGVNAGTATITVDFQSYRYANTTATYEVTVVDGTAANFYWRANGAVDGASKTINIVEGDFIMLPAIMGTSNGNNSYSVGSNKQYVYSINKGSIVRNTSDYNLNQGTPDISVSDETKALVFWARGTSETADTLMVFGRAAGDVQLIATDPQTGSTCSNINLHIVAKSTIETADETAKAAMSYPYTWDFTDMDMTNIAADASNDGSWIEYGDVYYSNGVFNYDYADSDNDGNVTERLDKMILANGSYLPAFNGLKVNLPGSTGRWNTKDNRFRVAKNGSYVYFNGGTYQLTLPDLTNVKSTGGVKLFVMAEGSGGKLSYNGTELSVSDKQIYTFDVSSPSGIVLNVDNVRMYWMGVSTEARSTTSYGMASYAYDQSLDFEKSIEANSSLTGAYAVTSFNSSTATLQAVDNAPAATGLVIKGSNSTAYYFVADARNMDEYTERTTTSELVGVTAEQPFSKPSTGYVYVLSNSGTDNTGKTYNEAGFYNYEGSTIPAQRSYLPVPTSTFSGSSSSGAKGFSLIFLDGEATGISEVTRVNVQDGDAYYNLNGVRVTNPSKGIYIHNGKKIVIK